MLVYYRWAGIVACLALLANLVLILAVMILVKAAFTLPGMAGLVLTVGIAVDNNVLIFERIREELGHGAAMRMAIRNGFSRATRTIIDANLTTLITALVLYWIGTDQIRGFAVTLILGIVMSMYTAIFCSRIVFDVAERKRWITQLSMMPILRPDRLQLPRPAARCDRRVDRRDRLGTGRRRRPWQGPAGYRFHGRHVGDDLVERKANAMDIADVRRRSPTRKGLKTSPWSGSVARICSSRSIPGTETSPRSNSGCSRSSANACR